MSSVFKFFGEIGLKSDEVEKGLKKVSSDSESTASKMTDTFKKAAIAIGSIFAVGKIIDFGKMAVEAAANAQAMEAQFEQVFGSMQGEANQMIDGMSKEFGILPERLMPGYTQLTSMFKGVGMESEKAMETAKIATTAAADAAAFYDVSMESAQGSITSFVKGNYEAGESIGIFANDAQMAQHAIEQGVVSSTAEWQKLDEATKQATRVDYIENMQELSGATGQASREADGLENVMGNLKSSWNTFLAVVGAPILKAVIPILQGITNGVLWLSDVIKPATESFGAFLEGIKQPFETAYGLIKSLFDLLNGGTEIDQIISLQKLGLTRSDIDKFLSFVDGFKSFIDSTKKAIGKEFKKLKDWFDDFVDIFKEIDFELLMEHLANFGELGLGVFEKVAEGIRGYLEIILTYWKNKIDIIKDLFKGLVTAFNQAMRGDWSGAFDTLKTAVGNALISMGNNIIEKWTSIWDGVKSFTSSIDWGATAQSVMTFLGNAISGAVDFLGDVAGMIKGWIETKLGLESGATWGTIGKTVLDLIVAGITSAIETVSGVASEIISWIVSAFDSTGDTDWLEVGTSILSGIHSTFSELGKSFGEIVVALIKGINDMMTAEQFHTLVNTLIDSIVIAIVAIAGGLVTIADALVDGIALGLLGADSWDEVVANISEKINEVLTANPFEFDWMAWLNLDPRKWDWSDTIWSKIPGFVNPSDEVEPNKRGKGKEGKSSGTASTAFGKGGNSSSSSSSSSSPDYATMATEATTGMNSVNQAIRKGYEAIRTTFTQMESNMVRLMTQIMTKLEQPVTSGMLTLNQRFRTGYGDIRTTFEQMGRNMERLMKQALTKVETAVNENMGNVVTAFRSKISQVTEAGRNTGQGFYNGLHSQRSRIVNLANDIAQSVIDTMEDALDINSPSGETEWIADMTIAGLVNNMKAGIQRVRNTTAQVADAMLFNPQEVDFNFSATNQAKTTQVTQTEYMLDELIQLTKQLVEKDANMYVEGQVFGEIGAKHINRFNQTQELRKKRIQGGTL